MLENGKNGEKSEKVWKRNFDGKFGRRIGREFGGNGVEMPDFAECDGVKCFGKRWSTEKRVVFYEGVDAEWP